jgi:hypothetical protein
LHIGLCSTQKMSGQPMTLSCQAQRCPESQRRFFRRHGRTSIKLRFARVELGQCTECVQDVAARQFVDFDRAMPLHVWRTDFDNTRGDARSVHCNFDNIADCGYLAAELCFYCFPFGIADTFKPLRQGLCSVPAATAHTFWQSSPRSQWLFTASALYRAGRIKQLWRPEIP